MDTIKVAQEVFELEIEQLQILRARIDYRFKDIVDCILNSKGRVIVTGIGKSGIIGRKIAASLASTGTNSYFMHAAEALHGDLGMVCREDVVIAISNSGSSQEVLNILPSLKKIECTIIAMTGNINSVLASEAEHVLDIGVEEEACPLGLAPTSSTTATLLMGDALVIALMKQRNFQLENFAVYHPGGALGRRLLTRVEDIMSKRLPVVYENSTLEDIIYEISSKRLGMTTVCDNNDKLVGIITDGDIRRNIFPTCKDLKTITSIDIMTRDFKQIDSQEMASAAWEKMNKYNISCLPVVHEDTVMGVISMHDVFEFEKK